jgi:hypothetical protein
MKSAIFWDIKAGGRALYPRRQYCLVHVFKIVLPWQDIFFCRTGFERDIYIYIILMVLLSGPNDFSFLGMTTF